MLTHSPFSVTIPATVPQRSEIPEGLMNYLVVTERNIGNKLTMIHLQIHLKGMVILYILI
jgi:hypothetical protein